jgi:hypothetical protein
MKQSEVIELAVVGCWPFEQNKSGFALPLFAHPENFALKLVQEVDEISGKVSGFRILEDADQPYIAISNVAQTAIGHDVIHAFLSDDGTAHAGTSLQLAKLLRDFTRRNPNRRATNLQIFELIGTEDEKKSARAEMRQTIVQQAGANAAANFYEGSTLRSILWSRLVKEARNEKVARRILSVRSRIDASIDKGMLVLNLDAISPEDRATINEDILAANILSEFEISPSNELAFARSIDIQNHNVEEIQRKVVELLNRINRSGRQEERIAILLDAIITDASIGVTALLQYGEDRAKLANWVLDQLRANFFQRMPKPNDAELFRKEEVSLDIERSMASLIPRLFTQQYPLSRGELLYYLAKHLAKWPQVNQAIKRSLDKTASIFVDNWRSEIERKLAEGHSAARA